MGLSASAEPQVSLLLGVTHRGGFQRATKGPARDHDPLSMGWRAWLLGCNLPAGRRARLPATTTMPRPEDDARRKIDDDLGRAGWVVQDADAASIRAARGVALREFPLRRGHGF